MRILTILLLLTANNLFGQNSRYFDYVNTAEIQITNSKYQIALEYYDSAFEANNKMLAQDLYNASICSIISDSVNLAYKFCFVLAEKNVGSNFFLKKSYYNSLRKDPRWKKLLKHADSSDRVSEIKHHPQTIFLSGLISESQRRGNEISEQKNGLGDSDFKNDSISQVLLEYFQEVGYPSEEVIGANVSNDTLLLPYPKFSSILKNRSPIINPKIDSTFKVFLFQQAVELGKLNPEVFLQITANTIDFKQSINRNYYSRYKCSVYKSKVAQEDEVNQFRSQYGACPLSDYLKKIIYCIEQPSSPFLINAALLPQENLSTEEEYLKTHALVHQSASPCE